jgi:nitronate monooxygenase
MTSFPDAYGITHPIVQAALGVMSMPPLVAAVSEAGGMGTLGAVCGAVITPTDLRSLIGAVRSLTKKPFGVNLITPLVDADHIAVCIEARVSVVSFQMMLPDDSLVEPLRAAGVRVWMQVGSVEDARAAARGGADAVIAQGSESGGGNQSVATAMTLVPAVVDAISPVPVIAAGGIADGRGMVAALALGADAVWIGTRFVASREANAHEEYKRRILQAGTGDTVMTTVFCGPGMLRRPVRALRNRIVEQWVGREEEALASSNGEVIGRTELGAAMIPLHRFSNVQPTPETSGDFDEMCLFAGESAGLIHEVLPAAEIVNDIMTEARGIVEMRLGMLIPAHAGR